MASLRPVLLETCAVSGLRERRRSSVNSRVAVPPFFSASVKRDDPVFDESDHDNLPTATNCDSVPPALPTLAYLRLEKDVKEIDSQKCHNAPAIFVDDVSSPSSSPTSTFPSRGSSTLNLPLVPDVDSDSVKPERMKWRLASAFFAYFLSGWGDGVTGTVLPHFMKDFHISYMMSSLLYAGATIGFMAGTLLVEYIVTALGRFDAAQDDRAWIPRIAIVDRVLRRSPPKERGFSSSQARFMATIISSAMHSFFFLMMGTGRGFWYLFSAYAVAAFSRSIFTAKLNEYFSVVSPHSIGYAYGLWSFGGVVSPLLCQSLMAAGVPWKHFYLGSLVLSAVNVAFLASTFRPTPAEYQQDRDVVLRAAKDRKEADTVSRHGSTEKSVSRMSLASSDETPAKDNNKTLALALRQPLQWAVSFFAFVYCGCETTSQGLIVSFLLGTRHANPKTVGYVSSGFWGGITVGRLFWGRYSPRLTSRQRKYFILACICIGLSMQVIICVVNSNIAGSVATAAIGLLYGPVFPACLALANDLLPSELRMVSMAMISAIASIGTSLFPFLAGTISSSKGIHVVPYITLPLATIIAFIWASFPTQPRRQLNTAV